MTHRMRLGRLFIATLACGLIGQASVCAQQVETRRVLALRVSFPQEIPDNETTSGDGTFDLRTFEEVRTDYRFPFDTPPHNRTYFNAHLQGLTHYFSTVSRDLLQIQFDILPAGETDSYVLTRPLIDYGNGRTRQEINTRIVELFRDGALAAYSAEPDLNFSAYDDVIVIHAGLGGESSNQLNDVPSAFINLTDLNTYVEGPIPVGGGTITKGILLPESGGTDGRSGLNGILARFYANQLGLPRLDNPEDGLPAIGDWSLMDTGNISVASSRQLGFENLTGASADTNLIAYSPSLLNAWSRSRLGWLTPTVIRHDTTLSIAAPHSESAHPQAIRIPISADEYFLIENRMSRLAVEGRRPVITLSEGDRGVWVANDDYDAFIPGSGILVWHIDDAVIDRSGGDKAVNGNVDFRIHFDGLVGLYRKGVALEEADGLEDIGNTSAARVITSGFISFASISGSNQDPYYVGNVTLIGPDTTPNTNSNLGYVSGIEIEILSAPGEIMGVSVRFNRHQDGWPRQQTAPAFGVAPKRAEFGDQVAILTGARPENGLSIDGDPITLPGYETIWTPAIGRITQPDSDEVLFSSGQSPSIWSQNQHVSIADVGGISAGSVSAPPLIAAFPTQVTDVWAHETGTVTWGIFGPSSGQVSLDGSPIRGMASGDIDGDGQNELVTLDAAGGLSAIEATQSVTSLGTIDNVIGTPVIADLNGSGAAEVIVASTDGTLSIFAGTEVLTSRPVPDGAASSPILSDIDGDGFVEVLFGGVDRVWVIRFNGVPQANTPYEIPIKDKAGRMTAPPLVADLDADGMLDVIAASEDGVVYAISAGGLSLPGFPILATGRITTSPLLDDIDGDGFLELTVFTDDGTTHLWHLEQVDPSLTGTKVTWGQQGGNSGNTNAFSQTAVPGEESNSGDLIPKGRAYVYPNPIRGSEAFIRYYLTAQADVDLIIINAAGQIVYRLTAARSDAMTDNEIRWDTTGYGSGAYICRLQATDGSRTVTRYIKAAIIR